MALRKLGLGLVLALAAGPAMSIEVRENPSFDCRKAKHADELAICRSNKLSHQDRTMARLFREIQACSAMGSRGANLDDQFLWIKRRARCGGNVACLGKLYDQRIAQFAPRARIARDYLAREECPGPV